MIGNTKKTKKKKKEKCKCRRPECKDTINITGNKGVSPLQFHSSGMTEMFSVPQATFEKTNKQKKSERIKGLLRYSSCKVSLK